MKRKSDDPTAESGVDLNDLRIALQKQGGPGWEKNFYKLAAEWSNEKCTFQRNCAGAIERIVNVVALQLETRDTGYLLVSLGNWTQGKVTPQCMLPGTKQSNNETPDDAIGRLLKQTHWKASASSGFRTKYVRSVVSAKLEVPPESIHFVKAAPKGTIGSERNDQERSPTETETKKSQRQ